MKCAVRDAAVAAPGYPTIWTYRNPMLVKVTLLLVWVVRMGLRRLMPLLAAAATALMLTRAHDCTGVLTLTHARVHAYVSTGSVPTRVIDNLLQPAQP